ncbi:hypothetical protein PENNAL_c0187G01769 [Penicillium nalgiovense]|uniref:Lysine-specific metallo-endopeptidase domain-containing protein n=1 Tax=Penicillium nalgiovense TaxID=60175 RepID=A0A1V6WU92_PENNA|nr:hypothetical protein PENNAL_c0187G01769 [Penicillium nalgiovense]
MGFGRPAGAFRTLLGQLILLTQIVLIAQAHPYGNHPTFPVGVEENLHPVVARASEAQFTALPSSGRIRVHTSCLRHFDLNQWDSTINQLKGVANYGKVATQMTLDMINDNMKNDNPTLHPQQRRMIDLFMVLYGSFRWDDVAAKMRVRDRAVRVNRMAALFANGLIQNTANWNFFCDESEWVLDPNVPPEIPTKFWWIKDLPAGPRMPKLSDSLCTIPDDYKAGYGGVQAEAVTLTAEHIQGNPNWITFCDGVWEVFQFQTHIWHLPDKKAEALRNAYFLADMINNTPERLLAHEFTHGKGQFGEYLGRDEVYGWVEIVELAKKDNAQTDATQSKPVINADTFTYWINGVFLEMCNFRSGRCEDPDQAAQTPQNSDSS